jgi:protease-4
MPNDLPPTPPGQTIVIERRERTSWFRRMLGPLLFVVLFLMVVGFVFSPSAALPTRLTEHYVAGDLTASKVAIVEVSGLLLDDEAEHVRDQIRQARDDDAVRAVVLRVDSPGGSVTAADQIWRELKILGETKPIVASMGGMAASGGYYVAAPCDFIFAEPTTMTGSIGVIMEIPKLGGLLEKVGVDFEVIKAGEWKDSPSYFHPMSPEERERWSEVVDQSYQRFLRVIADGRRLPLDEVRPAADGKVFTSSEALRLKLIDAEGYLDDAIRKAWNLSKLANARVVRYARPFGIRDALLGLSAPRGGLQIDAESLLGTQIPRLLYLAR